MVLVILMVAVVIGPIMVYGAVKTAFEFWMQKKREVNARLDRKEATR